MLSTPRSNIGLLVVAVALVVLSSAACGGDDGGGSVTDVDRSGAVAAVIDDVVVPRYRAVGDAIATAVTGVQAFCSAPTEESRAAAHAAVSDALSHWEALDPIDMGPIMERRADQQVAYPPNADRITIRLGAAPPQDAEAMTKQTPANARGLGAAEVLLSAPVDATTPVRCTYLNLMLAAVDQQVRLVLEDWFTADPPYGERAAGRGANAIKTKSQIDTLINMMTTVLGADGTQLGKAAQLDTSGEAPASGSSTGDSTDVDPASVRRAVRAHVATIAAIWGTEGEGLSSLVSDELADEVTAEFEDVAKSLDAEPFDAAAAQSAVDAVRATIGTEIVAALDVVVGFSENDGDS